MTLGVVELGARLTAIDPLEDEELVVCRYDLVTPAGERLGFAGEVRVSYAALDVIDERLGGTTPLTKLQRVDLVAQLVPPLWCARFAPTSVAPAPPTGRQDVTVHAHGEVVDMRGRVPSLPKE